MLILIWFEAVIARLDRATQRQKWIIRSSRIMTPFAGEFVLNNKRFMYKVFRLVVLSSPAFLFRRISDKSDADLREESLRRE